MLQQGNGASLELFKKTKQYKIILGILSQYIEVQGSWGGARSPSLPGSEGLSAGREQLPRAAVPTVPG